MFFETEIFKVELNLSSYATKSDLKNATGFDTRKFAENVDLASWTPKVEKLNIGKLEKVLTGLSSLESEVDKLDSCSFKWTKSTSKEWCCKKTEYAKFVKKRNAIQIFDTTDLVKKKTGYNTKTIEIKKKKIWSWS